jgi:amino acid transporter
MQSLGEMATLYPTPGAFTELAGRFIDPAFSVALGWNYWYLVSCPKTIALHLRVIANPCIVGQQHRCRVQPCRYMPQFLDRQSTSLRLGFLCWAFYQAISLFGVIVYGELEFWLALWKILCVMVTYLLAILVNTGGIGGDYIGFRYWKDPGPFANGINGFGQSFVLAAVYHCGTELVAITGGESRNPARDLPKVCFLASYEKTTTVN